MSAPSIINNPEERVAIFNAIKEISNSFIRSDAEKSLVLSIITEMSEKYNIEKKVLRKMAKTYYKSNFLEEKNAYEEFEDLYTVITGETTDE